MATTLLISQSTNTATLVHNEVGPFLIDLNKPSHAENLYGKKDDKYFVIDRADRFPQFTSVEVNIWLDREIYNALVYCYLDYKEATHDLHGTDREIQAIITVVD